MAQNTTYFNQGLNFNQASVRTPALSHCHQLGSGHACPHACHGSALLSAWFTWGCLFTYLACASAATVQHGCAFSHTGRVPGLLSGVLLLFTHPFSPGSHMLPEHTCLHTCCVSVLPLGSLGMLLSMFAVSLACHLVASTCLFTHFRNNMGSACQ